MGVPYKSYVFLSFDVMVCILCLTRKNEAHKMMSIFSNAIFLFKKIRCAIYKFIELTVNVVTLFD